MLKLHLVIYNTHYSPLPKFFIDAFHTQNCIIQSVPRKNVTDRQTDVDRTIRCSSLVLEDEELLKRRKLRKKMLKDIL
jgi:hypothetical protein